MLVILISLHIILPVFAALLNAVFRNFSRVAYCVTVLALAGLVAASTLITVECGAAGSGISGFSYVFGNWPAKFGIEFKANVWNGMFLMLISVSGLASFLYGYRAMRIEMDKQSTRPGRSALFTALLLVCMLGLYGVVLTNDFFNLYVFMELSTIPVYAMISWNSRGQQASSLSAAFYYLITGAVASTLYLIGVGCLYSATGALNVGHVMEQLGRLAPPNVKSFHLFQLSPAVYLGLCLMAAGLLIKSAVFPVHSWLLKVYEGTNSVILPFLGGTSNKIYLFAFVKLFVLGILDLPVVRWIVLGAGLIAVLWLPIAALLNRNLRTILALSGLAQVGYALIVFGFGLKHAMLIGCSILINYGLAAMILLMITAKLHEIRKSYSLDHLQSVAVEAPGFVTLFAINSLSLIGFPATTGLLPKFGLFAGFVSQQRFGWLFVMALASFLTFAYLFRVVRTFGFGRGERLSKLPAEFEASGYVEGFVILALTALNVCLGLWSLNFLTRVL